MRQRGLTVLVLAIFCVVAVTAGRSRAARIEAPPKTYLEDRAGVIEAGLRQKLIGMLQELEQKTEARLIVLTVPTTDGVDIADYTFQRARAWKFGANRKLASMLIVVATKDKRYRVETGYKQEGVLPDALIWQVTEKHFKPNFRAGRFGQGIAEGTVVLAQTIAKEHGVDLSGVPRLSGSRAAKYGGGSILPLLIIIFLMSGRRSRGMLFWGLLAGSMVGGRGGGSFGGGGFGGFGGGGGGGFGGGGVSGSW